MEPNLVRMYSSSPPPFDEDGEEEDDDDFGEFGGYCCGVSSSISFSDYDMPTVFDQSPPDLYNTFTQNVGQPGKESTLEESEKIAKNQEAPNSESLACETDVFVDSGNGKIESSEVLPNIPLSPDSEREVSVAFVTRKHSTSEHHDLKLICKEDQQQQSYNSKTAALGLCNGPITLCTDNDLVQPLVTSTESVVVSSTKDVTTETEKAFVKEHPIDSNQLLEDSIPQTKVGTLAGEDMVESNVDSKLAGGNQSNQKQEEVDKNNDLSSENCGTSGTLFCEIPIQSASEVFEDTANTSPISLAENVSMSDTQDNMKECSKMPPCHVVKEPIVELGQDFKRLLVVDQEGTELDAEANPVLKEVQRVILGSSGYSDEDFGIFRDATQSFPDVSQTEFLSQEGFTDFVTALSDCSSHDEFPDAETLKDLMEEDDLVQEDNDDYSNNVDTKNPEMPCSELPPSDSFADFSSVPFGDLARTTSECWAAFGQQEVCEEQQESWATFEEQEESSTTTAPSTDNPQADSLLVGFSNKLQHLFERTFPLKKLSEDSDVLTLQTLLAPQNHAEISESVALWRHLLDIHNTHGLKVQWVGSHSNRILLDCLGIYNILFTGQNKQPVIVPMFAAGLGMLEPTKEPVKLSSIFSMSSPPQGRSTLCAQVVSSLSPEDDAAGGAVRQLNLDFFGPVEDCSSDTDTPMPGVDPELYELTTTKLEDSNSGSNMVDAFSKLMETVDKNSTVTRKPKDDGDLSEEAAQMIALLPNLSFMHARVLMFPSTLTPTDL